MKILFSKSSDLPENFHIPYLHLYSPLITLLLRKNFEFWQMDRITPPFNSKFSLNHLMDLKFSRKNLLYKHSIYLIHTAILHKLRRRRDFFLHI